LSYLQLFPFDFVKIDRPFVNRMASDQANTGMTAAMLQMAASLNLTAIAEIIETEEAAQALQAMGCDYGQGHYFSEPIEAEPALQLLRGGQPFQPRPEESSATLKIRPLGEDGSPTIRIPVESPTVKIRPLQKDSSPTIRIPVDQLPDQPAQEMSPTVKIGPLDEDGSPTIKTRVDQQPDQPAQGTSPTMKIRLLEEDGSPTIRLAVDPIEEPQL
jgi:EAL domain